MDHAFDSSVALEEIALTELVTNVPRVARAETTASAHRGPARRVLGGQPRDRLREARGRAAEGVAKAREARRGERRGLARVGREVVELGPLDREGAHVVRDEELRGLGADGRGAHDPPGRLA